MRPIDADALEEWIRALYCDPESIEYDWASNVLDVIRRAPTASAQEEPARLLTVEEMRSMPIGAVIWEETHPNELPAGLYNPEERIDPMVKSTWNSIGNVLDNTGLGENEMNSYKQYQLLALAHLYGDEPFVFTDRLYTDVMFAAKQCGFKGGGSVRAETRACIVALESEIKEGRADWVKLIEAEYGITFPQWVNLANGQDYWEERKNGGLRLLASQHGEAGQRQPEEWR